MGIVFYYDLLSQPSRALYMLMKKEGIKFESKTLDLFKGEHKTDKDFGKVNPSRQVPAIVDDGFNVVESVAIMMYLVKKFKKDSWIGGSDLKNSTRVQQFLHWHHLGLRKHCISVFLPTFLGTVQEEKDKEEAKKNVINAVEHIEKVFLTRGKFIGGDKISIADLLGYCELQQLTGVFQEELYTKNSKVNKWMEDVAKELGPVLKEGSASIDGARKMFEEKSKGASQQKKK